MRAGTSSYVVNSTLNVNQCPYNLYFWNSMPFRSYEQVKLNLWAYWYTPKLLQHCSLSVMYWSTVHSRTNELRHIGHKCSAWLARQGLDMKEAIAEAIATRPDFEMKQYTSKTFINLKKHFQKIPRTFLKKCWKHSIRTSTARTMFSPASLSGHN